MLNKKDEYTKIRSIVLSDENIKDVILDVDHDRIVVFPYSEKEFYFIGDILDKYRDIEGFKIDNKHFKIDNTWSVGLNVFSFDLHEVELNKRSRN